ncbi:probable LRR receptor-like serine/threonine-protein kinase At1g56140 isoform X2 [Lycium barbarum]|uniref:probable LRR receptor-like serine/threonine-protein kinase At1g56140 isoform X2 n=1 Tax=Lycium barbarum TaxID=112863 RepID=UPI00293E7F5E|nr:probable LRR receptor-like serine/threonine-protein kinase At1g56140 isoform X2 [Lycium barbarum]
MGLLGICFLVLWLLKIAAAQPLTDPIEVDALNKIIDHWNLRSKLNLTGDPCAQNAPWAPDQANPRVICVCSATICHITHLKIYALDISGELPKELFLLKELMDLNLAQNVINGTIPAEIRQLTKMQYLSLGINNLTGPVPPELGSLTKLVSLSFSSNNFSGPLPPQLGNLTSLQQLYIDSSGVNGPIPQELSNLKSLEILWASDNRFTGKLPEFFAHFMNIQDLRLEGTLLEGPIPSNYGALIKLQDLRIGALRNKDSSLDFVENMTSLSILSLRNCRIADQLPEKLISFRNLQILDLSFNKLTGQIPNSYQDFASLQFLDLGSNKLSGELPPNIMSSSLTALDVSFNSLSGYLPPKRSGLSMNIFGNSISDRTSDGGKASSTLSCLQGNTKCIDIASFSMNSGGTAIESADDTKYANDLETLSAASFYMSPNNQWAVSSSGIYISNPHGQKYTAQTGSQITGTLDSELYKTARISPTSLRYYGFGLSNGRYHVELHFAEIQMDDSHSWKGLGRRLFDVYVQGEKVLEDFNIQKEAGGSKRALVKTIGANVTNRVIEIHLLWAGKGTCCIPFQSTYGPLVSAIHVTQVAKSGRSSKNKKTHVGIIFGIVAGSAAGVLIVSSVFCLWWANRKAPSHMKVATDSTKKG